MPLFFKYQKFVRPQVIYVVEQASLQLTCSQTRVDTVSETTLIFPLQESKIFWSPTADMKASRLKRYTVPVELQGDMESER